MLYVRKLKRRTRNWAGPIYNSTVFLMSSVFLLQVLVAFLCSWFFRSSFLCNWRLFICLIATDVPWTKIRHFIFDIPLRQDKGLANVSINKRIWSSRDVSSFHSSRCIRTTPPLERIAPRSWKWTNKNIKCTPIRS